ncbi:MAG: hypothetical protein AB8H12_21160 [Lewinella sp.]
MDLVELRIALLLTILSFIVSCLLATKIVKRMRTDDGHWLTFQILFWIPITLAFTFFLTIVTNQLFLIIRRLIQLFP